MEYLGGGSALDLMKAGSLEEVTFSSFFFSFFIPSLLKIFQNIFSEDCIYSDRCTHFPMFSFFLAFSSDLHFENPDPDPTFGKNQAPDPNIKNCRSGFWTLKIFLIFPDVFQITFFCIFIEMSDPDPYFFTGSDQFW